MTTAKYRRERRELRRAEGMSWRCANDNHQACAGGVRPEGEYGRPDAWADPCTCYCHDGLTAHQHREATLREDE
jgi:hypothetical protein